MTRILPSSRRLRFAHLLCAGFLALCGTPTHAQHADPTIAIEPSLGGGWWDPSRSGEGWQIEVLSATQAIALWYTYPAAEQEDVGEQLWIGGPGRIEGHAIVIDPVLLTRGARFGANFNPGDVEQTPWGRMRFTFASCHRGRVEYEGPAGYGSGTVELQRLTGNPRLPCGVQAPDPEDPDPPPHDPRFPPPDAQNPGLSGTWYDPAFSGQGWFIQEVAPGTVAVMWFASDDEGHPAQFLGLSRLAGRALVSEQVQIARGTHFGADFDPADVQREDWGALQLTLDDCDSGQLSYRSRLPGFGAGRYSVRRLSQAAALQCAFPRRPDLAEGSWVQQSAQPRLSEMPAATLNDHIWLAGGFGGTGRDLWRFDPGSSAWTGFAQLPAVRHHGMLAAHAGRLYFFGGFSGGLAFEAQNTVWRFDPAGNQWQSLSPMPSANGAGTALTLGDKLYVVGGVVNIVQRYDPIADTWETMAIDDPWPRDHSAAVVYEEEIWIIGGRSHQGDAHYGVTIFNPLTGVSRPGPDMLHGRSGFGAAVAAGQIFVAGGEDLAQNVNLGHAEYYSPWHREWRPALAMPTAVHGVAAATLGDRIWFLQGSVRPGGIDNPGLVQSYQVPAEP